MPTLGIQLIYLFLLALVVACVAWTVTHEEVFKELRSIALGEVNTVVTGFNVSSFIFSLANIALAIMLLHFCW
jgi:hypothetical protein